MDNETKKGRTRRKSKMVNIVGKDKHSRNDKGVQNGSVDLEPVP